MVIAGYPGSTKSILASEMWIGFAKNKIPSLLISLEMSEQEIIKQSPNV